MARILFFNIPTTGHVDPTLAVAAELVRRGHKLDYFLTDAYRPRVEATGSVYHAYEGIGSDYFEPLIQRFNPVRLATQLVDTAGWLLPSLTQAIRRIQPQAIVYDSMCPWGRVAARQAGQPAIASMALLDLPMSYLFKSGEWRSALPVMTGGLPWMLRFLQAARRLKKTSGVSAPSFIQVLNWPGDHNLCYTARMLLPNQQRFGADYSFVGPPIQEAAADIPFPFDKLAPDRPLIYVSLGTVFNRNPGFFRACLAAFAGDEVQVVVSTGNGVPIEALAPVPENAIIRSYVPQDAILARASAYISHSGVNSVHQALQHGVPMLLVPQQTEQALTAARVVELGAGLILNRQAVTREKVRGMANRLMSEGAFRLQAAAIGARLNEAGGAPKAADAVERMIEANH